MKSNCNDVPPLSWAKLGEQIALAGPPYNGWQEAPWLRVVISKNEQKLPRVEAYELTEAPYVRQIEEAVELWLQKKPIPVLDATASFLLALRFQVVGGLLMSFEHVGSLMPPAPDDEIAISRRFLIDWWRKNGAYHAVGSTCAEFAPGK
jgi:hypothetical protein